MKFYRPDKLKEGMCLAKPIYDKRGVLLYDRGAALTPAVIKSIMSFSLIGLFIKEPGEVLPPISDEESELESLQSSYMFRLRDIITAFSKNTYSEDLDALVNELTDRFGHLTHRYHFGQLLRSNDDYTYKHSVCTAILVAMMSRALTMPKQTIRDVLKAVLLADIGYIYLPEKVSVKSPAQWNEMDEETVRMYRKMGMEMLKLELNEYGFSDITLAVLNQSMQFSRKEPSEVNSRDWHIGTKALMVADKYDRMTAVSLTEPPTSSVQAFHHLQQHEELYSGAAVKALSRAILILNIGQCVKLSDGKSAMVMELNNKDAFRPTVMIMENNSVVNLNSPQYKGNLEIVSVLDTLDTRYVCDEETLKHFIPDESLTELIRRYRLRLAARGE